MQYKKFEENFLLGKKLLHQKWTLEKTLYFEKNLLLTLEKTLYFEKNLLLKSNWKQSTLLMITRPALYPAGSTFWNKTPKSQLPINRISSSFFASHLLASLKAIECSTGPSVGSIYQNWILQVVGLIGWLVLPAVGWSSYH